MRGAGDRQRGMERIREGVDNSCLCPLANVGPATFWGVGTSQAGRQLIGVSRRSRPDESAAGEALGRKGFLEVATHNSSSRQICRVRSEVFVNTEQCVSTY